MSFGSSLKGCIAIISCLLFLSCQRNTVPGDNTKIQFAIARFDSTGLLISDAQADYEFCIPAKQKYLDKVLRIEPAANVMKGSRGRIGCTKEQWLCIISTKGPDWNEKLNRIARLSFVEKIIETYYE